MKQVAWVYILESLEDRRFYIGSTSDLDRRLKHHLGGHTPSTKRMGNLKLVFSQQYDSLQEARFIERKLKNLKRKDYLQEMIKDGYIKITLDGNVEKHNPG